MKDQEVAVKANYSELVKTNPKKQLTERSGSPSGKEGLRWEERQGMVFGGK